MIVHVKVNIQLRFQQLNPICVTESSEKVLKLIQFQETRNKKLINNDVKNTTSILSCSKSVNSENIGPGPFFSEITLKILVPL